MAPQVARVVDGAAGLGGRRDDTANLVQAAGCVVWRVRDGRLQVQLIHRPRYEDWSWPKGKVDPGELLPTTAVREVAEETGKPVVLGIPLPGLQYLTQDGTVKRVHYWAARRATAADPCLTARHPVSRASGDEIDGKEWVSAKKAFDRLTRKADRAPLDALVVRHREGLLDTRAVVVLRHAHAVPRAAWHGEEELRPLTPAGHGEAHALVPVLAAFGVERLLTSDWRRCVESVEPYCRTLGIDPTLVPDLSETRYDESPDRLAVVMREALASPSSTALCTHRPLLPAAQRFLAEHATADVAEALSHRKPLQPGQALVAHVAGTPEGPLVVGVERLHPKVA